MSEPTLPPVYDPAAVEIARYQFWLDGEYFKAARDSERKPFTIVIPPPNVTGSLHMGHALNNTIQDILIRWRRMQGFDTLWLPGCDHAGIATQNVVEKHLAEEGITAVSWAAKALLSGSGSGKIPTMPGSPGSFTALVFRAIGPGSDLPLMRAVPRQCAKYLLIFTGAVLFTVVII
jgi:hypothetical protein